MRTHTSSIECQKSSEKKAESLLQRLQAGGGVVWHNVGAVTIDGVVIPRANILDLIYDSMRDRKRSRPFEHLQFAATLCNTAIPREFIVANVFSDKLQIYHLLTASASSGGESYCTPSHSQSASASSGGETDSGSREKRKRVTPEKRQSWIWRQMSWID